jgi:hypothetical protein
MLTVSDLEELKKNIEEHNNKRIQLETEINLIKKDLKEKFGIEDEADIDDLIKELLKEQKEMEDQKQAKLKKLTEDMQRDGLL